MIDYRSCAYDLAHHGETAFRTAQTLKSLKDLAKSVGLDEEQTDILLGAWREAKAEAGRSGERAMADSLLRQMPQIQKTLRSFAK